jgi:cytoskeleton protein RodZ
MGHFGDKFRQAREKKELTLDQVSNVTKISSRMLKAIEDEHFDQLPGGVFNKGFIRAYAKHLGLNDEEAVNDYLTCLREAQVDAHEVWEPEAPPKRRHPESLKPAPKPAAPKPQPPVQVEELPDLQLPRAEDVRSPRRDFSDHSASGIPWRLVTVAAVTVILAMVLWIRHSRAAHPATAMANTQAAAAQPAPSTPPTAPPPTNPVPAPSNSVSSPAPSSVPVPPSQPPSAPHPSTEASSPPAKDAEASTDVTVRNFDKTAPKSSEKGSGSLTLVIRASENSWISVLADGQLVTQETLIAPANTSVHASREITVRVGNAAGVTFLFNGQEVPAQGDESEVKIVTFDSSGIKSVPAQSPPAN